MLINRYAVINIPVNYQPIIVASQVSVEPHITGACASPIMKSTLQTFARSLHRGNGRSGFGRYAIITTQRRANYLINLKISLNRHNVVAWDRTKRSITSPPHTHTHTLCGQRYKLHIHMFGPLLIHHYMAGCLKVGTTAYILASSMPARIGTLRIVGIYLTNLRISQTVRMAWDHTTR